MKIIKITSFMLLALATLGIKNVYSMKKIVNNKRLPYKDRVFAAVKSGAVKALEKIFEKKLRDITNKVTNNQNIDPQEKTGIIKERREQALKDLRNATYGNNYTLLHISVLNKRIDMLKYLLEDKFNPHFVDFDGNTALDLAKQMECKEKDEKEARIMSELLYKTLSDEEKLFFDIKYKKIEVTEININRLNVNKRFYNNWTYAHAAAYSDSLLILVLLGSIGNADLSLNTDKNCTPLEIARKAQRKSFEESGMDDIENYTPYRKLITYLLNNTDQLINDEERDCLYGFIRNNNITAVKRYIEQGKDINFYHNKTTPLHMAIKYGLVDIADLFISHGANIHATDEDGRTPLHLAVEQRLHYIIILLLSKGADRKAIDGNGHIPADLLTINLCGKTLTEHKMKDFRKFDVSSIFILSHLSKEAATKTTMHEIYEEAKKKADELIEMQKTPPPPPQNKKHRRKPIKSKNVPREKRIPNINWSAHGLTDAIRKGNVSLFRNLSQDMDINTTTFQGGNTFLHLAIAAAQPEIVKELLKNKNLRLTTKNENNQTPSDLAVLCSKTKKGISSHKQILKLLTQEIQQRRLNIELEKKKLAQEKKKKK